MRIGSYGHVAERSRAKWVLYHNPKCSKSCDALYLLRSHGVEPEIVEYLVRPLSKGDLKDLLALLKVPAKELIRTKDTGFSKLGIDLEDEDLVLNTLVDHPEWMQRPIVIHKDTAIIARPPEKILELLS